MTQETYATAVCQARNPSDRYIKQALKREKFLVDLFGHL
jgi:hypothetical protein